jgi:N-acyl-phosphatidylethanolamine-hydrolysing phospholipase D
VPPTKITFIGHATLLIEMNGVKILTDPILGRYPRYLVFFKRRLKAGMTIQELLDIGIDVILLSHSHIDHYHVPTLRQFPKDTPLLVPPDLKKHIKSAYKHFSDLRELPVWASDQFNGVTITAVPANHPRKAQGYVIAGNHVLYFPGDTGLFDELNEFHSKLPPLDVVFLPMMPYIKLFRKFNPHIDDKGALEMVQILKPKKYAIPIHFGFYPMRNYLKFPNKFKELLEQEGLGHLYHLLLNGETLELP